MSVNPSCALCSVWAVADLLISEIKVLYTHMHTHTHTHTHTTHPHTHTTPHTHTHTHTHTARTPHTHTHTHISLFVFMINELICTTFPCIWICRLPIIGGLTILCR